MKYVVYNKIFNKKTGRAEGHKFRTGVIEASSMAAAVKKSKAADAVWNKRQKDYSTKMVDAKLVVKKKKAVRSNVIFDFGF